MKCQLFSLSSIQLAFVSFTLDSFFKLKLYSYYDLLDVVFVEFMSVSIYTEWYKFVNLSGNYVYVLLF